MAATVVQAVVFQNSIPICMARITGVYGSIVTRASLSSITYKVTDISVSPTVTITPTTTIAISNVIFDTPVVDGRWTKDAIGYSFLFQLAPTDVPSGAKKYQVEFWLTPTTTNAFPIVYQLSTTTPLYGP